MEHDSRQSQAEKLLKRYGALLALSEVIALHRDLASLFHQLAEQLRSVVEFDGVATFLYDEARDTMRVHLLESNLPGLTDFPEEMPLEQTSAGWVWQNQQPLLIPDISASVTQLPVSENVRQSGVRSACILPLTSAGRRLGALGFGSVRVATYSEADLEFLQQVANHVAIAVENALNFERARKAEQEVRRQLDRERLMLEINNAVVSQLDLRELARVTAACLRDVLQNEVTGITLYDPQTNQFRAYMFDLPDSMSPIPEGTPMPLEGTVGGMAFLSGQPIFMSRPDPAIQVSEFDRRLYDAGVQSGGVIPLIAHGRKLGFLGVGSFREDAFSEADQELLSHIANQIALAVENALNYEQTKHDRDRFEMLLEIGNAVSASLDMRELLRATSIILRSRIHHDIAGISLFEEEVGMFRVMALDNPPESWEEGFMMPLEGTPDGLAFTTRQIVLRERLDLTEFPSPVVQEAYRAGIRSGCSVPLIARDRAIGVLAVGSNREASITAADVETLQQIANQIASAVENALNFERARVAERQAKRQSEQVELLLQINNAIASALDLPSLFRAVSACLRQVFRHDYAVMGLYNEQEDVLRVHLLDRGEGIDILQEGQVASLVDTPVGLAIRTKQVVVTGADYLRQFPSEVVRRAVSQGLRANCSAPLLRKNRVIGAMSIASKTEAAFSKEDGELFMQIAGQVAIAVENALAVQEIETLKNKLASEKLYLEDEIRTEHNFEELIGESPTFKRILKQIETVAPTDSAVLIRGETGTGKELIARAIHNLSDRRERTLVKLNCAAIPTGLLESELFGHERGAFTGAITQRIGRFELAHKGTLLLDEIGDIPLELQPKLLRVLQEQEFERLGSTRTQKVDVRLIAATNCDLEQMVAERKYRSDLFYRLNVFPITIPPLRQRREDIPALVRFFTQKYARRLKKQIAAIPAEVMTALTNYHWPGNVRELEHFVERGVILTRGDKLEIPLAELKTSEPVSVTDLATLEDAEREHIVRALEQSNWVVGGPQGAAARLGMKRTTLQSKMQKLGIARQP